MTSAILIQPAVWPQYTNVTERTGEDRQTDRQRTESTGRTVLQTVAQKKRKKRKGRKRGWVWQGKGGGRKQENAISAMLI